MSAFVPLNVEIEEESEDEIDDSKEIQIEEALKLYQNALKLHSQGPLYYEAADSAYKELFRSEIFTWEESLSEAQALERYNGVEDSDDDAEDTLTPTLAVLPIGRDGTPSSLPQILYLAYKNHGQFLLDRLKDRLSKIEHEITSQSPSIRSPVPSDVASSSLERFVEALDRDDTDLELWRLVSRIGSFLGSHRVARFCLEAVLDGELGASDSWTDPSGLEAGFAQEQLRPLLKNLDDHVSQSQVSALFGKHRSVIPSFKKRVDPCPYLTPSKLDLAREKQTETGISVRSIEVPSRSFASIGKAIKLQLDKEIQGIDLPDPGAKYLLIIPSEETIAISPPHLVGTDKRDREIGETQTPTMTTRNALEEPLMVDNSPTAPLPPESIDGQMTYDTRAPQSTTTGDVSESPTKVDAPRIIDGEVLEIAEPPGPVVQTEAPTTILADLPTRKRSSDTAELPDSAEVGRVRSKRIKAKGSYDADAMRDFIPEDWATWFKEQLSIYYRADDLALEAVEAMLSKLGSRVSTSLNSLRQILSNRSPINELPSDVGLSEDITLVTQDLRTALDSWDVGKTKAYINGHDSKDPAGRRNSDFMAFLLNSNGDNYKPSSSKTVFGESKEPEMTRFTDWMEKQEWTSLSRLAYRWVEELLVSSMNSYVQHGDEGWYQSYVWPDELKKSIVQILVSYDRDLYSRVQRVSQETGQEASQPYHQIPEIRAAEKTAMVITEAEKATWRNTNLVQIIFELHLDVYGRITHPNSEVDEAIRTLQRDRLRRWAALASEFVSQWSLPDYPTGREIVATDRLYVRFLWATTVCNNLLDPAHRDTTILCYQDLIQTLREIQDNDPSHSPLRIELCNNAIMPEISIEAAKKEISKLTTMDFFMGIFNPDNTDPFSTIESLEPLLDLSIKDRNGLNGRRQSSEGSVANSSVREVEALATCGDRDAFIEAGPDPKLSEALTFLKQGNLQLRLFLWQKLRDAYRAIAYSPQVLVCDLRMMSVIIDYLESPSYSASAPEARRDGLLRWLHRLDDHVTRVLAIALNKADAFDCMDEFHVRSSLEALTLLQKIVHVFAHWEDTIRVGKIPAPTLVSQHATKNLARLVDKFRDMTVKIWTLQYLLLKEAIAQNRDLFEISPQELIRHLERVHHSLGLRYYCSLANKIFLKLMKKELETFKVTRGWDADMSQLMYDLYGVKISINGTQIQEHGCTSESLDRETALEIMDLVMTQADRISARDLLKSDLKVTIEKMQQVVVIPKINNSTARTFNNRLANNYLKSPLNPYELYRSLRGLGGLCGAPVHDEGSVIAAKGWYFLQGYITLLKFRLTKRLSAGSMDDLNVSKTFLRHDLEFNIDKWETWYRLGQVYNAMVDEEITWMADKLENHMTELTELQRKAMHCFSMAVAVAIRCAEGSFEETSKIADLYADFGTRVYASTREPLSMRAFGLDDHKRHYNSRALGMYQGAPFQAMQLYSAWKFASILLRRASAQQPRNWVTWYTYGKVLWKMHNCSEEIRGRAHRIGHQKVINALVQAVEACPERRDSRHPDKDPVLEPHYKLLSVVHKLVRSRRVSPEEGRRILQATPYARKAPDLHGEEGWNGYVWQILKTMRAADKVNWHHRMVARAAHIMYDDEPGDPRSAVGAKNELSQQIFTKTMAVQVWKPENERPGRHFVYTGRYVRFFTRLLYQLNDKTSLEALARRIRKRAGDFVNHSGVWDEVCRAYLKLLHHQPYCPVTDGYSEIIFQGMDPEIFQMHAARLETHVHSLQTLPPLLDILREAIELKKLNNNLFKPINPFEDLIRDIYAHLYDSIIPGLVRNDAAEENRVRMRVDNILSDPAPNLTGTPPPDGFGLLNGEQPKKTGARYVTQREIVRKAEAIAAKPAPTVPVKVLKPLAPAPASELGTRPLGEASRLAVVIQNDVNNDVGSSVPGSVHDSADDESELSEVDDDVVDVEPDVRDVVAVAEKPSLFPNLVGATAAAEDDAVEEEVVEDKGDNEERVEEAADADVDVEEVEEVDVVEVEEQMEEEEAEQGDEEAEQGEGEAEQEVDVGTTEIRDEPVKASGLHEGSW